MTTVCILITGSRAWSDVWAVKHTLDSAALDAAAAGATELILRHGACYPRPDPVTGRRPFTSADYLAHLWARRHAGQLPLTLTEQARPADWTGPCRPGCRHAPRTRVCPAAGTHRNLDMILEPPQPYHGYAFLLNNSPGTTHCMQKMADHSIPVTPIVRATR